MAPGGTSRGEVAAGRSLVFYECFAGVASLSSAVGAFGVNAIADEVEKGGTDFEDEKAVLSLKAELEAMRNQGSLIMVHLAPPCSTFSRARDRSKKTRLRSSRYPEGLPGKQDKVASANVIARSAFAFAVWAAERGFFVSLENPRTSYLWDFLEGENAGEKIFEDFYFSPCMFGAPFQKPTTLRCWGWQPKGLAKLCSLHGDRFACGRAKSQGHEVLEFGGGSTKAAADYHPGVCQAWALDVANALGADATPGRPLDDVRLTGEGRVRRHVDRGTDEEGERERKKREDDASMAGMRNPARLIENWPDLWRVMSDVRVALEKARNEHHSLRNLTALCGSKEAVPPPEGVLQDLRRLVGQALLVPVGQEDAHHDSSPWRFELVRWCQSACGDPDTALAEWLEFGAPMGITKTIEAGGLFPAAAGTADLTVEELDALTRTSSNHPSFAQKFEDDLPPGVQLMQEYVAKGFGRVFVDTAAASAFYGREVHPAPMGTVSKQKEDGSWKHRPIQDLRKNKVRRDEGEKALRAGFPRGGWSLLFRLPVRR